MIARVDANFDRNSERTLLDAAANAADSEMTKWPPVGQATAPFRIRSTPRSKTELSVCATGCRKAPG
jgi:hypothetical protein